MIQKVLFLPPGSAVIQYVVEFLSASSHFDLSNLLCHRSGKVVWFLVLTRDYFFLMRNYR